jgi:4-amino-4-deoxy-L-arabinose transferase
MFKTYFTTEQLLPLFPSLLLIVSSILVLHYKERTRLAMILLIFGALGLRVWAALLDPFLNLWDEQYHALVAKNLMSYPFKPMLIVDPVLPYGIHEWDRNHIWLHKQPLYLWQIAASFKLFGINEFTLRLPSVLLSTAVTYCIYRMGKLSLNPRAGFYAALLWALSSFGLNLVSGRHVCDHNDVAFVSYITASLWAWTEYEHSGKKKWIFIIGLLAGMAVLVKWLTGMLVFGAWGMAVLFDKEKRKILSSYLHIAYSVIVAVIVFLPWQLYILHTFPEEAKYNYALNAAHFTDVIPPHDGDAFFHYHAMQDLYGDSVVTPVIVILSFILLLFSIRNRTYRTAYAFTVLVVYTFFTLAATKMTAFCFPVCSIIFIAMGNVLDKIVAWLRTVLSRKAALIIAAGAVVLIGVLNLAIEKLQSMHTPWKPNDADMRYFRIVDKYMYKRLPQQLPEGDFVIFGCREREHVMVMFYTDYTAYDRVPDEKTIAELKSKGIKMAAYDYAWLPDHIRKDPGIIKIKPATP